MPNNIKTPYILDEPDWNDILNVMLLEASEISIRDASLIMLGIPPNYYDNDFFKSNIFKAMGKRASIIKDCVSDLCDILERDFRSRHNNKLLDTEDVIEWSINELGKINFSLSYYSRIIQVRERVETTCDWIDRYYGEHLKNRYFPQIEVFNIISGYPHNYNELPSSLFLFEPLPKETHQFNVAYTKAADFGEIASENGLVDLVSAIKWCRKHNRKIPAQLNLHFQAIKSIFEEPIPNIAKTKPKKVTPRKIEIDKIKLKAQDIWKKEPSLTIVAMSNHPDILAFDTSRHVTNKQVQAWFTGMRPNSTIKNAEKNTRKNKIN